MAGPGFEQYGNFVEGVGIAEDYTPEMIFKVDGLFVDIKIKSIRFLGGVGLKFPEGRCVIKNGDENAATICTLAVPDAYTEDRVYFKGGQYMKPFIDYDKGIFNAGHKVIFEVA